MGQLASTLLEPISAESPSGADLYYEPEFEQIKEARRQDDSGPRGVWERDLKAADYKLAAKLAETIFKTKSKDLRLAVWLAEAWIYRDGAAGLVEGLQFLRGLVEGFWETLYPAIEDGDLEGRAAPLEWFGTYFNPAKGSSPKLAVCRLPLVKGKYDFLAYQESRKVGYEADGRENEARKKARDGFIAEGKVTAEQFDAAFEATPKAFYKDLDERLKEAVKELAALDGACRAKFGDEHAPAFLVLRGTIEEAGNAVHILLSRRLKSDPDPVAKAAPAPVKNEEGAEEQSRKKAGPQVKKSKIAAPRSTGGPLESAEQAIANVIEAAEYLRGASPASPVPYLLLRAVRWGEVRERGEIQANEFEAPAGDVRVALRGAAAAGNWREVLEISESAMSDAAGQGWLDLQRYAVKACEELGFKTAATAVRSELKCFLADFPELPLATLADDTGAANPETLAWLEKEGLLGKRN